MNDTKEEFKLNIWMKRWDAYIVTIYTVLLRFIRVFYEY